MITGSLESSPRNAFSRWDGSSFSSRGGGSSLAGLVVGLASRVQNQRFYLGFCYQLVGFQPHGRLLLMR